MAPIKAGSNKLITHITKVADKIPTVLTDTKPNKKRATDPLTPISVIAIVGIIEITKSIAVVKIKASIYEILTSKTCKRIKLPGSNLHASKRKFFKNNLNLILFLLIQLHSLYCIC